jgi:ankyrin repeat protein
MMTTLLVPLLFCLPGQAKRPKADDAYREALVAAVHRFAEKGELDHLRAVLDRHPKLINLKQTFRGGRKPYWTDDYTALHRAAEQGQEDVVAYLIKKGADVNATGPLDWTPLHVAAQKGDLAIVKRLVKAGAKVGARTAAVPEMVGVPGAPPGARPQVSPAIPSLTPLELAQKAKRPKVVEYLKAAR